VLRQLYALCDETVEIWRLHLFRVRRFPTRIAVPEVIGEDVNDVARQRRGSGGTEDRY